MRERVSWQGDVPARISLVPICGHLLAVLCRIGLKNLGDVSDGYATLKQSNKLLKAFSPREASIRPSTEISCCLGIQELA